MILNLMLKSFLFSKHYEMEPAVLLHFLGQFLLFSSHYFSPLCYVHSVMLLYHSLLYHVLTLLSRSVLRPFPW